MKFESNRAWQDGIAMVSANRDVLVPLAGVFFLVPAIAQVFFFSDIQQQILASLGDTAAMEAVVENGMGGFMAFGLIAFLVQLVGYLAMLALLTDRTRPTVGQALMVALTSLPTLIGALVLFVLVYAMLTLAYGLVAAAIGAVIGSVAIGVVLFIGLGAVIVYVMIKFSLTLPVVIIERQLNPVRALLRSWSLTKGNSFRLALFYLLLLLAYMVITLVFSALILGIVALLDDGGRATMIVGGILSGVVAAVAGIVMTGILAAIHRQLAGPSAEAVSATFD